jgi:hypothetical protein
MRIVCLLRMIGNMRIPEEFVALDGVGTRGLG